jgi:uncharacterized protein
MIDISPVLNGKKAEIEISQEVKCDSNELRTYGVTESSPVILDGRIFFVDSELYLELNYRSEFIFECSRCLEGVKRDIQGRIFKEILHEDEIEEEIDAVGHSNYLINLYDVVMEDLILSIPIQVLCDSECKGLCPNCGINLNQKQCDCEDEKIDPRFESLKQLFKE